MTKGELIARIQHLPDDTPVQVNVTLPEYMVPSGRFDNFDTTLEHIMADSFMCPGYPGCTHTEPELDSELVLFVYHPEVKE